MAAIICYQIRCKISAIFSQITTNNNIAIFPTIQTAAKIAILLYFLRVSPISMFSTEDNLQTSYPPKQYGEISL